MVSVVYAYHFVSIIIGMNQYVHYTRFLECGDAKDFLAATDVYDTALFVVLLFHIVEWVRQTVLITVILVGVKWLPIYYGLTVNVLLFLVAVIMGLAAGFGSDDECKTK